MSSTIQKPKHGIHNKNIKSSYTGDSLPNVLLTSCAFIIWGFYPLFFALVKHVPAINQLTWRMIWTAILFIAVSICLKKYRNEIINVVKSLKNLSLIILSCLIICFQNYLYIIAVTTNHVLDISLAYYITPIVNIGFGALLLREKLSNSKKIGIILAFLAIAIITLGVGQLPLLALAIGISFGTYGFIHKITKVSVIPCLTIENFFASLLAFAYMFWNYNDTVYNRWLEISTIDQCLFVMLGVITFIPLIFFTEGTQRVSLSTLGFLMYIEPSLNFIIAITLLNETINPIFLSAFIVIWMALTIISIDSILKKSNIRRNYRIIKIYTKKKIRTKFKKK